MFFLGRPPKSLKEYLVTSSAQYIVAYSGIFSILLSLIATSCQFIYIPWVNTQGYQYFAPMALDLHHSKLYHFLCLFRLQHFFYMFINKRSKHVGIIINIAVSPATCYHLKFICCLLLPFSKRGHVRQFIINRT